MESVLPTMSVEYKQVHIIHGKQIRMCLTRKEYEEFKRVNQGIIDPDRFIVIDHVEDDDDDRNEDILELLWTLGTYDDIITFYEGGICYMYISTIDMLWGKSNAFTFSDPIIFHEAVDLYTCNEAYDAYEVTTHMMLEKPFYRLTLRLDPLPTLLSINGSGQSVFNRTGVLMANSNEPSIMEAINESIDPTPNDTDDIVQKVENISLTGNKRRIREIINTGSKRRAQE